MKNKIMYVTEIYMDEERTLQQAIQYKHNDYRQREYLRGRINPHLTELVCTRYYNEDWEIIEEQR